MSLEDSLSKVIDNWQYDTKKNSYISSCASSFSSSYKDLNSSVMSVLLDHNHYGEDAITDSLYEKNSKLAELITTNAVASITNNVERGMKNVEGGMSFSQAVNQSLQNAYESVHSDANLVSQMRTGKGDSSFRATFTSLSPKTYVDKNSLEQVFNDNIVPFDQSTHTDDSRVMETQNSSEKMNDLILDLIYSDAEISGNIMSISECIRNKVAQINEGISANSAFLWQSLASVMYIPLSVPIISNSLGNILNIEGAITPLGSIHSDFIEKIGVQHPVIATSALFLSGLFAYVKGKRMRRKIKHFYSGSAENKKEAGLKAKNPSKQEGISKLDRIVTNTWSFRFILALSAFFLAHGVYTSYKANEFTVPQAQKSTNSMKKVMFGGFEYFKNRQVSYTQQHCSITKEIVSKEMEGLLRGGKYGPMANQMMHLAMLFSGFEFNNTEAPLEQVQRFMLGVCGSNENTKALIQKIENDENRIDGYPTQYNPQNYQEYINGNLENIYKETTSKLANEFQPVVNNLMPVEKALQEEVTFSNTNPGLTTKVLHALFPTHFEDFQKYVEAKDMLNEKVAALYSRNPESLSSLYDTQQVKVLKKYLTALQDLQKDILEPLRKELESLKSKGKKQNTNGKNIKKLEKDLLEKQKTLSEVIIFLQDIIKKQKPGEICPQSSLSEFQKASGTECIKVEKGVDLSFFKVMGYAWDDLWSGNPIATGLIPSAIALSITIDLVDIILFNIIFSFFYAGSSPKERKKINLIPNYVKKLEEELEEKIKKGSDNTQRVFCSYFSKACWDLLLKQAGFKVNSEGQVARDVRLSHSEIEYDLVHDKHQISKDCALYQGAFREGFSLKEGDAYFKQFLEEEVYTLELSPDNAVEFHKGEVMHKSCSRYIIFDASNKIIEHEDSKNVSYYRILPKSRKFPLLVTQYGVMSVDDVQGVSEDDNWNPKEFYFFPNHFALMNHSAKSKDIDDWNHHSWNTQEATF